MPSLVRSTVSHYRILEHLGGGGMSQNDPRIPRSGMKFLVHIQVSGQSVPVLTLVTNWDAGLKRE